MPKFEVDGMKHVLIKDESNVILVTAYDPSRAAVKVGFSYLPIPIMVKYLFLIFESEKDILESLVKAGKIKSVEPSYHINNICFFYSSNKVLIKRGDDKYEVRRKLLIAEQE